MIEVKDNFLTDDEFKTVTEILHPKFVPWSFQQVVGDEESNVDATDNFQFSYTILPETLYYPCLVALFDKMDMEVHFRLKVNLNPKAPKIIEHGYHIDLPLPQSKTAVFYLNTNNGYTAFETGEKVESVANRIVMFDSHIKHTGTTCTDVIAREVLNINYMPKEVPQDRPLIHFQNTPDHALL